MARSIIILNVFLYGSVVAVTGYGIYSLLFRNVLPVDLSPLLVDLIGMRLLIAIPTLVCVFGLVRFAPWGRKAAISWNIGLFFFLGVLPIVGGLFAAYLMSGNVRDSLPTGASELGSLVAAGVFLVLAVALRGQRVCEYFDAHV